MNKPVVLAVSLGVLLVFFVVSCGVLRSQVATVSAVTMEAVPSPTLTKTSTAVSPTPTVTVTSSPTVTETPAPTSTRTLVPTPTLISLQKAVEGYTFYGTQLKFLEENFGWSYDLIGCPNNYYNVTNVLTRTPGICAGKVYVSEGDRKYKYNLYLLEANFSKSVEGVYGGVPYGFMFYLYKGAALPSDVDWLNTSWFGVQELIWGRYIRENAVKYSENKCAFREIPTPGAVFPLTPAEYEALASLPNLFPLWIETCSIVSE